MHNNIMAAGSRDRLPMLATRRYPQWQSCFLRYIDKRPNGDALRKFILEGPYQPTTVTNLVVRATENSLAVPKRTAEVKEIRAESITKNVNPLSLVAAAQSYPDPYYQAPKSRKSYAPTSKALPPTRSLATTRHKGKELAKPITPPSESASEEDSDPEQAQRDKDMQKNLALIAKYKNDNQAGQFGKQRTVTVVGARETVGSQDTDEEIDEQELKAHYSFIAKIQEVLPPESNSAAEPLEQDDSNVTPDSPDMCDNDIQIDQNAEDERVALANLIANLKHDIDENKKIQKQLKKANASLAHELKECKSILAKTSKTLKESNSIQDSCLVSLQNKQTEFKRPHHRRTQMKDKVMPNNSQVKDKKTKVEDRPRISSISNKTKSVTTCNDSLKSRTSNVNVVCDTYGKCLVDSDHFACVTKLLNDVNARTKKPNVVPISTRKPKGHANKSVATPLRKQLHQNPLAINPRVTIGCFMRKLIVQLIIFIVDSGCTKHMTGNLMLLCNFVKKYLEPEFGFFETRRSELNSAVKRALTNIKILVFREKGILRRDLRVEDNPALAAGVRAGQVIAVYIWAPEEEGHYYPGKVSRWWLKQSLALLDSSLKNLGTSLVTKRSTDSVASLLEVVKSTGATQPEWSRFVTIVKKQHKLDKVSYHKLFYILKQYQKEVNELRAERLARNANPLELVATAQANQDPYYQTSKSHKSYAPSSKTLIPTRTHTTTRYKGKEIAKPITPPSETASEEDSDLEQAQRDKDM
nr:cryptochrome1c [Tanacetum cinerariifolium]